jgi:hypothetical protein
MLPLLRILKEKNKLNIDLSETLQYLSFGDGIDPKNMGAYAEQYVEM